MMIPVKSIRALSLAGAFVLLFILSGCSDDDSIPASLSATEGDGIPELTGNPSFSPSTVSAGSDVTVSVPVDSDTTHVQISLGIYDSSTNSTTLTISSAVTSVSSSATTGIAVTVTSGSTAGAYVARIKTCSDGVCATGSTGRDYVPFSIYQIFDLSSGSFLSNTSVAPPTFTVQ